MRHTHITTLALSSLCLLAACGGGGGGGGHGGGGGGQASGPSADIQFPPQASLTDANTIAVRGTVESPGKVAHLMVRGVPAATTDGWKTWSATVPLVLGSNELEVLMLDAAGDFIGDDESVSVERQDVVLGNCTGLAMGAAFSEEAYWLDADHKRVIHIDLLTGARWALDIQEPVVGQWLPSLTNPGEPVYDSFRGRMYVPDGGFIHTINVWTGALTTFPGRGLGETVLDIDYLESSQGDPADDMLVALESRAVFNGLGSDQLLEIVKVDLTTGDSEVLRTWNRTVAPGKGIDATRISLEHDGNYVDVASTDAVWWLELSTGKQGAFDKVTLSDISDISRSMEAGWISILDRSAGIFDVDINNSKMTKLYSFDDADSPLSSGFTLSPGRNEFEYIVTDEVQDAVYSVETDIDTVSLIASSAMGSGPSLAFMWDETEFQGLHLASDVRDCIYSIASDGTRTEFAKGEHLIVPTGMVALGDTLYVGCGMGGRVVMVDPNGNQSLWVDQDPDLMELMDLALAPGGGKLIALTQPGSLIEIDISTGFTQVIARTGDGMGPDFVGAVNLAVTELANQDQVAFVSSKADGSDEGLILAVHIDDGPDGMGFRYIIAGEDGFGGSMGAGAPILSPRGLSFEEDTTSLLVSAAKPGAGTMSFYRLDLLTLQRTELGWANPGQGPLPDQTVSLRREAATGNLHMTAFLEGALYVVDPISGDRVIASR